MGKKSQWTMKIYRAGLVNPDCAPAEDGITFEVEFPAVRRREAFRILKRNFPNMRLVAFEYVESYQAKGDRLLTMRDLPNK